MKLSARNQLKGKVVSIERGAVNGIVHIELKGGDVITSTISLSAIDELGLEVGREAYAVIKATSVIVGVDHHHCK
ncbi:molybdopterin-binding protein [Selenomonas sp. F0473]|uniref:TOBE domain-containing protein n=1 Tax=Selenomonas sp. F0473 TaxID=999423 RepID=UPI00029E3DFE|nr:TOBE domain-containing protein [Selenomonas sp. F0473]EKU70797.1 molybdenum-pterin binding domain-containing protein [Selenomonas sp. F0473]